MRSGRHHYHNKNTSDNIRRNSMRNKLSLQARRSGCFNLPVCVFHGSFFNKWVSRANQFKASQPCMRPWKPIAATSHTGGPIQPQKISDHSVPASFLRCHNSLDPPILHEQGKKIGCCGIETPMPPFLTCRIWCHFGTEFVAVYLLPNLGTQCPQTIFMAGAPCMVNGFGDSTQVALVWINLTPFCWV